MGLEHKGEVWNKVGGEGTTLRMSPESSRSHLKNQLQPESRIVEVDTRKNKYGPPVQSFETMENDLNP